MGCGEISLVQRAAAAPGVAGSQKRPQGQSTGWDADLAGLGAAGRRPRTGRAQSSGMEADLARRSAATLGHALPLGPLLSPTDEERSVVASWPLSSWDGSRCMPSAPGTWAGQAAIFVMWHCFLVTSWRDTAVSQGVGVQEG